MRIFCSFSFVLDGESHSPGVAMKLHVVDGSPTARRVQAVINHLGLRVEYVTHDSFKGALRDPQYLALNPNATAPTLVDGSFVLWESVAIMQYLADKAGDAKLFPRDLQQRAEVVRWQCWQLVHFNRAVGEIAFEIVAKGSRGLPPDEERIASARERVTKFAPVLDAHMRDRRYLVGDHITIADYSMIAFEAYRPKLPFDWQPYPNLNAYFDRMHTVDAWVRAQDSVVPVTRAA
jgi:glutathione S-transferase